MGFFHMQYPRIGVVEGDTVTGNARDYVTMDGQNHLAIDVNPGDL